MYKTVLGPCLTVFELFYAFGHIYINAHAPHEQTYQITKTFGNTITKHMHYSD